MSSRGEVVVTFLAMLELIRLRQLAAVQDGPLQPIRICRTPEGILGVPSETPSSVEGTGQLGDNSAV
jgi:chromatin segregation and condensation protein Rec8/ScpA/Scc1 (kleisin family)